MYSPPLLHRDKGLRTTAKSRRETRPHATPRTCPSSQIKIAAWNVNGFGQRSAWAVEQVLIREVALYLITTFILSCHTSQKLQVFAISETHFRQDVPRKRFDFCGYKVWHADRGGQDKVKIFTYPFFFVA